MRYPVVIGNWKLNGNKHTITNLLVELNNNLNKSSNCTVIIAPPILYLDMVTNYLINSNIITCAQNVDIHSFGAFTGEISPSMLKDMGVKYVIIGHSERRIHHKESDFYIAEKFAILQDNNLIPVLCVGENARDNQCGQAEEVCINQINAILNILGVTAFKNAIIAYEPVWAIGTCHTANPLQVQKMHKCIRNYIAGYNKIIAGELIIQYGGSVNINNVYNLLLKSDIDGVLVGNASLKANEFILIVQAAIDIKLNKK